MRKTPESVNAAKESDVGSELRDGLVQMSFAVMAILNRVGAQHELSMTQLRVLGILADRQPKMIELADFLGLDRSSVSGLIDRAVNRGLVERISSPDDGRSVHVSLTTGGRLLAHEVGEEVRQSVAKMVRQLTPAEQRRLGHLLDHMRGVESLVADTN
jgi:DNA-binding MarR family transcriptional regulator